MQTFSRAPPPPPVASPQPGSAPATDRMHRLRRPTPRPRRGYRARTGSVPPPRAGAPPRVVPLRLEFERAIWRRFPGAPPRVPPRRRPTPASRAGSRVPCTLYGRGAYLGWVRAGMRPTSRRVPEPRPSSTAARRRSRALEPWEGLGSYPWIARGPRGTSRRSARVLPGLPRRHHRRRRRRRRRRGWRGGSGRPAGVVRRQSANRSAAAAASVSVAAAASAASALGAAPQPPVAPARVASPPHVPSQPWRAPQPPVAPVAPQPPE